MIEASFIALLAMAFAAEPVNPPSSNKPSPVYALSISATVAPDYKTPIPLIPVRLAVIHNQNMGVSLMSGRNLQKDPEPIETYALSEKKTEIPSGTTIPLPLTTRTAFETFIRLSGQTVFADNGFLSTDLLIRKENNCMIDDRDHKASCVLSIPSIQMMANVSPTTKHIDFKIFKQGSVLKSNMKFFPLAHDEQPEDYLKKFSRPDFADARRKEEPKTSDESLYEKDGTLFGYFLYSQMSFHGELPETDVAVSVKENGYPWSSFQYSVKQSAGRLALLPGAYRIERFVEDSEGKKQSSVAIVSLAKWGEFIPAEKIEWTPIVVE